MLVSVDRLIGQMFGSYQLERLLGSGSLSSVFAASNTVSMPSLDRPNSVMVTVFELPTACEGNARERFIRRFYEEAQHLTRLSHPNIVPVYDFGEQYGYFYLVTPLTDGNSLSMSLKQYNRYTPMQTLPLLQQMASALDYAHRNGSVHGSLKLSNVLLVGDQPDQQLYIAGFGLVNLLEMRGIGQVDHPYPQLFSVAGTLLLNTTYLAPEVIKGQVADTRSDVYALGIIVFELLSGRPPFVDSDPFVVARQQLEARRPSLQDVCSDISDELVALDLVLQRALERDPAHRLSSAGKLANAFKRALNVLEEAEHSTKLAIQSKARETQKGDSISSASTASVPIVPSAVSTSNWLVDSAIEEDIWMEVPGSTSAKLPTLGQTRDKSMLPGLPGETGTWRNVPLFSSQLASVQPVLAPSIAPQQPARQVREDQQAQKQSNPFASKTENRLPRRTTEEVSALRMSESVHSGNSTFAKMTNATNGVDSIDTTDLQSKDPFATSTLPVLPMPQTMQEKTAKPSKIAPVIEKQKVAQVKGKPPRKTRRAVLLTGGVVAACALGFGGFELLNNLRGQSQQLAKNTNTVKKPGSMSITQPHTVQKSNIQNNMNEAMLLGNKNTPLNSARDFMNPADQKASVLVRLPSGDFVAYEKACTHQGVLVVYDPVTHKLVCPLHHSVFDPANKASVLSGPAPAPLPKVAIQVLPDGSVIVT